MRDESSRSAWTKKQKQSHKQGAETSVSDTVAETCMRNQRSRLESWRTQVLLCWWAQRS